MELGHSGIDMSASCHHQFVLRKIHRKEMHAVLTEDTHCKNNGQQQVLSETKQKQNKKNQQEQKGRNKE